MGLAKEKSQIDTLTGVRGIAALWVVFRHLSNHLQDYGFDFSIFQPLIEKGYLGVDLFFILSGFVISLAHQNDFITLNLHSIKRFLTLRLARMYPIHLFMLFLFGVIAAASFIFHFSLNDSNRHSWAYLASGLLLLQAWLPSATWWNAPSWSISAEWLAYLAFPLLSLLTNRVKSFSWNVICLIGFWAILVAYYFSSQAVDIGWHYGLAAFVRIAVEFPMGCFLFNIYKELVINGNNMSGDRGAIYSSLAILVLLSLVKFDYLVVLIFALFLLCLALSTGMVKSFLASRLLKYLGEISYSIYMCHMFLLAFLFKALSIAKHDAFLTPAICLFFLFLIIAFAHILYNWVEQPARRFVREKFVSNKYIYKPAKVNDMSILGT